MVTAIHRGQDGARIARRPNLRTIAVNRPQADADTAFLGLPGLSLIRGMKDDTVITDGPDQRTSGVD